MHLSLLVASVLQYAEPEEDVCEASKDRSYHDLGPQRVHSSVCSGPWTPRGHVFGAPLMASALMIQTTSWQAARLVRGSSEPSATPPCCPDHFASRQVDGRLSRTLRPVADRDSHRARLLVAWADTFKASERRLGFETSSSNAAAQSLSRTFWRLGAQRQVLDLQRSFRPQSFQFQQKNEGVRARSSRMSSPKFRSQSTEVSLSRDSEALRYTLEALLACQKATSEAKLCYALLCFAHLVARWASADDGRKAAWFVPTPPRCVAHGHTKPRGTRRENFLSIPRCDSQA